MRPKQLQWFKDNRMKANPDKYHLLANNTKESFQIKIGNETISNSKYEELLGVKVDHELNFNEHVSSLCKKASQKLNALSRIVSCMTFDQRRLILNSYCPMVLMFHSRKLYERINHVHERALRIVYKDFHSSFQELLIEDNSLNIHHRSLQKLVTEIFKVKNGLPPELMMFLSLPKNHTPYGQLRISCRGMSVQQNICIETPSNAGPQIMEPCSK